MQPALVELSVNGVTSGEAVAVLRDGREIYVPLKTLQSLRFRADVLNPVQLSEGPSVRLGSIEGLTYKFIEETQSLEITAVPNLLERTQLGLTDLKSGPMTPSSFGGFLNYEIVGQHSDGQSALNGVFELGLFNRRGFGTSTFIAGTNELRSFVTRLDTSWTIDDVRRMRSVRFGDSISRGGVGGVPVRFGGIQFGSNFNVEPGFITIPLPSVGGSAALSSVVDVYVNNTLQGSRNVNPGPFSVINVPVVTGSGDVQLIVKDVLGRETVISQSYYVAPQLLRRGLHDYSYEAGFLRRNYTRKSNDYGDFFISGTHRYGISNSFTGEAHAEATTDTQLAGLSGNLSLDEFGLVEAFGAVSRSDHGTGTMVGLGFERRTRGLSFGARSEFTSENFTGVGLDEGRLPPSKTLQLFFGMPVGFGSIGGSYLLRDNRDGPDAQILSATASVRFGDLGTLHLGGRKNFSGEKDTAVELLFSLPIGKRSSASASMSKQAQGMSLAADFQRNPPAGEGVGYRVSAVSGGIDRLSGRLSVQTSFGNHDAELSWTDGKTGLRYVASGGLGVVRSRLFAARKLTQSFATVQVGDFENVRVYADNQLVGKTNKRGTAVIPRLRPYEQNAIRIEVADLPMDAIVTDQGKVVRPHDRSGVSVGFDVKRSRSAVLTILLPDGKPIPAGARLSLEGASEQFIAAPDGQVFLTGLASKNTIQAQWAGQSCRLSFDMPDSNDPQPDLGKFTCALS